MLSDRQDILNSSTNTSNNNISQERSHKKYSSAREIVCIPCALRTNRKSATSNDLHLRRDIYGSLIIKGGRKHKVSFIDRSPMREIKVSSYKAYNAKMVYNDYSKYPGNETTCCCESSCVII